MRILTLETTCDETAAAVVTDRLEVLARSFPRKTISTSGSAAWCRRLRRGRM